MKLTSKKFDDDFYSHDIKYIKGKTGLVRFKRFLKRLLSKARRRDGKREMEGK